MDIKEVYKQFTYSLHVKIEARMTLFSIYKKMA